MPKIRTVTITASFITDHREFEVPLMYISGTGFYIEVPDELQPVAKFLSDEEIKKFKVSWLRGRSVSINNKGNSVVCLADNESDCLDTSRWLFTHLCKNSIQMKGVIVVHFEDKGSNSKYTNDEYNEQHPVDGFTFGLTYCSEERVGETGEAKYYKYTFKPAEQYFKESTTKRELRLYNNFIVIDDTPENRELLEHTYGLYAALKLKLKKFLGNKDELLNLIALNQKLIN